MAADAPGGCLGSAQIRIRKNDQEFIPAVAGDDVDRAGAFTQGLCHGAEHLVSRRVAVTVVDILEAVDVQNEQDRGPAGAVVARQFLFGLGEALAAIGEARQLVNATQRIQSPVLFGKLARHRVIDRADRQRVEHQQRYACDDHRHRRREIDREAKQRRSQHTCSGQQGRGTQ
ncbi:MAG TPA: hypothetical protein VG425_11925 [Casimicrobiaceae bacterium]|nr:hypothetical protein [Casimicrobiaceae bacterium]